MLLRVSSELHVVIATLQNLEWRRVNQRKDKHSILHITCKKDQNNKENVPDIGSDTANYHIIWHNHHKVKSRIISTNRLKIKSIKQNDFRPVCRCFTVWFIQHQEPEDLCINCANIQNVYFESYTVLKKMTSFLLGLSTLLTTFFSLNISSIYFGLCSLLFVTCTIPLFIVFCVNVCTFSFIWNSYAYYVLVNPCLTLSFCHAKFTMARHYKPLSLVVYAKLPHPHPPNLWNCH